MADFNARINVTASTTDAEKAVKKLEKQLERVNKQAENFARGISGGVGRGVKDYTNTLSKLDRQLGGLGKRLADVAKAFDFGGKTVVGVAGINALAASLSALPQKFGGVFGALRDFGSGLQSITSPIEQVVNGLQAIGPAGLATAGGIAATTAALMAFSPAAVRAAKAAKEFQKARQFRGAEDPNIDLISEKIIRDALKSAVAEQKQLTAGTSEYTRKTEEVVALQRELTGELRRQEIVLNQVNRAQVDIGNTVRQNIRASQAARDASGFGAFSQRAGAQTAIDKSIRRQQDKLARQASGGVAVEFQKALPSAELLAQRLKESGQQVQRLSSFYGDLNTQIDRGTQEATRFTNELTEAAARAQQLPPEFGQLEQILKRVNKTVERQNNVEKTSKSIGESRGKLLAAEFLTRKGMSILLQNEINDERKLLQLAQQQTAEAQKKARIERRNKRLSKFGDDLLLGVGFPLLFGGGAGSVLGGGLGSAAGLTGVGGFGAQIAGSAIGQIVDQAVAAVAELGQAFSEVTPDVDRLVKAAGLAGTSFGELIGDIEDTAEAAKLAASIIEQKIGSEGVQSLRDFGDASAELGRELQVILTSVSAVISQQLLPLVRALADRAKDINLERQGTNLAKTDKGPTGEALRGIRDRIQSGEITPAQGLEEQKKILEEFNRGLEQKNKLIAEGKILQQNELELEFQSKELIDLKRQALEATGEQRIRLLSQVEEAVAKADFQREKQQLINRALAGEISFRAVALELQGKQVDLQERLRQIQEGLDKSLAKANKTSGGGVDKEAQVQRTLAQLTTKRFEQETKLISLGQTKADQLAIEQLRMTQLFELRRAEIQASTEDQRIKEARLALLLQEEQILMRQNQLAKDRLKIEENLKVLRGQQGLKDLERGLQQELSGITIPTGNRDLDERNALAAQQANRYANAIEGVNAQIKEQELLQQSLNEEVSKAATFQLKVLRDQKALYEEYLPAISAAEQQQLAFNQSFAKVKPIADAVAGSLLAGIRGVIDGTKTAEEAFKDFLNTIVDLLLKTAAEMIATYIAIGIARQFAGLGGGTGQGSQGFGPGSPDLGAAVGIPGINRDVGGRTMANMPYVVGEKGAELFVPGKTGTIVPADVFEATRQAIAGNGPEGGDSDAFAQNAVAMGNTATITKENALVREMGMRENEPIDVRYESTVINNVSYVSEEQFQKGLKTAVAQSKSAVFSDLKNKPSARAGIGMR